MIDMSLTVAPKSNQTNADDLIAGPRTITITKVTGSDEAEQPVSIHFEGDNGKPYKPCKSMRRVLLWVWGKESQSYVGRKLTIYNDPNVIFGGVKVGGIRISHMSHLDKPFMIALTASKTVRKPFTVQPLTMPAPKPAEIAPVIDLEALTAAGEQAASEGVATYRQFFLSLNAAEKKAIPHDRLKQTADAVDRAMLEAAPAEEPAY